MILCLKVINFRATLPVNVKGLEKQYYREQLVPFIKGVDEKMLIYAEEKVSDKERQDRLNQTWNIREEKTHQVYLRIILGIFANNIRYIRE